MPAPALHFPVRVPDDLLLALGEHTGVFWSDSLGMAPFVCEAIRNYINPPPPPQQPAELSEAGYQWKEVFLPEGTRLRCACPAVMHGCWPMSAGRRGKRR